jgi:hypothetical protein
MIKLHKILICGGRDFNDKIVIYKVLDEYINGPGISYPYSNLLVITGGCRGADLVGMGWAEARGIHPCKVDALWDTHGNMAGPIRNRIMALMQPDVMIAFPGGAGTADMIKVAETYKIPTIRVTDKGDIINTSKK